MKKIFSLLSILFLISILYPWQGKARIRDFNNAAGWKLDDPNNRIYMQDGNDVVGIDTTHPRRKLDIRDPNAPALRITHTDNVDYMEFQVNSSGDAIVIISGKDISFGDANISTTGNLSGTLGTIPVNQGGTGQTSYTNGQLLIGNTTGNTLSKSTISGTTNQVTVTNGAGSIMLSTPQNIDSSSDVKFSGLILKETNVTIDPNESTYLFDPDPNSNLFRFTVNESSGCTVTMSEVSAITNKLIYILNLGPYSLIFQDQEGVSNFRDAVIAKGAQDNCIIIYDDSNMWLEWEAGNN